MSNFVDRRLNGKGKSSVNRQRFTERFKTHIKEAVGKSITSRDIETNTKKGINVHIPVKDISEPQFGHGSGGIRDIVVPGNKDYIPGDSIDKPKSGGKGGASKDGVGEDDFEFELSREEYLKIFFEDLELPNLIKKQLLDSEEFKNVRAGYTTDGVPTNINVVQSLKKALGRRVASGSFLNKALKAKEEELENELDEDKRFILMEEIAKLKTRKEAIRFIDPFDLKFNNFVEEPVPSAKAVMFAIMDVSGSMGEKEKDIAKRFFILLYLFLSCNYEKVKIVYIRHHTEATEVDEDTFFHLKENGGTIVSSALKLTNEIIQERYNPQDWNIYVAQASDGDNWSRDSSECTKILSESILPNVQYYAYIEIAENPQELWNEYSRILDAYDHFNIQRINDLGDIYPVFRKLFERQQS